MAFDAAAKRRIRLANGMSMNLKVSHGFRVSKL